MLPSRDFVEDKGNPGQHQWPNRAGGPCIGRQVGVTIRPTVKTFLIRNFVFGLVIFFLTGAVFAKNISEEDIRAYLDDPIFDNLWFGIYDKNDQKYGW